jgi:hypothetical protein
VNRLAWLGSWFSCCVPDSMQTSEPTSTIAQPAAPTYRAFGGAGQTLGSASGGEPAAGGGAPAVAPGDDMRARRERAIAAAEARAAAAAAAAAAADSEGVGGLKTD